MPCAANGSRSSTTTTRASLRTCRRWSPPRARIRDALVVYGQGRLLDARRPRGDALRPPVQPRADALRAAVLLAGGADRDARARARLPLRSGVRRVRGPRPARADRRARRLRVRAGRDVQLPARSRHVGHGTRRQPRRGEPRAVRHAAEGEVGGVRRTCTGRASRDAAAAACARSWPATSTGARRWFELRSPTIPTTRTH